MEVKLKIELKNWTNPDTKEVVQYFECSANILGQVVKFSPKNDYKPLLKLLYELNEKQKSVK